MAHIQWTDDLNTGIQVIDSQHHRIVQYINNLDDVSQSHDRNEVEQVLAELVDYTLSHFTFEESLMQDAGYPFINGHKRVHDLFVKRVGDFQLRFKTGEDVTNELLTTLKAWLVNHIKSDDNDYVDLVKMNIANSDAGHDTGWLARSVKRFFG